MRMTVLDVREGTCLMTGKRTEVFVVRIDDKPLVQLSFGAFIREAKLQARCDRMMKMLEANNPAGA